MNYECSICYNDILEKNIHYMECFHYICFNCFKKLVSNTCPFCRQSIQLHPSRIIEDDDIFLFEHEDNIIATYHDDFIIPMRRYRHEIKRQKLHKKKEILNNIIESDTLISQNLNVPNNKIRFNRKCLMSNKTLTEREISRSI